MAVTLDQVRRRLDAEEPNYPLLARELGPEAAGHLRTLAANDDELLASKAVYLAGLIPAGSADTLEAAARSDRPVLRIAAAAALALAVDPAGDSKLSLLLDDDDPGVRKTALRSAGQRGAVSLRAKVQRIESTDPEPSLRRQAGTTLAELPDH